MSEDDLVVAPVVAKAQDGQHKKCGGLDNYCPICWCAKLEADYIAASKERDELRGKLEEAEVQLGYLRHDKDQVEQQLVAADAYADRLRAKLDSAIAGLELERGVVDKTHMHTDWCQTCERHARLTALLAKLKG